ncbi:MAG: endonuclease III [Dechloromonas agitata]|uniref:Endonuclease III n=1 Tax=Dechloromonas agitata TaxID=73030 RepID=A0A930BQY3_9RHOO|nr:endonuclease III [Dechloromonas agitata]
MKKALSLSGRICFRQLWRKPHRITTPPQTPPVKKSQVAQFYARLREANPAPTTELHYATPFQLLIAVILSAQATDVGVNKATARLFPVAPTPDSMLALGEEGLADYIKTIGLYRTKARNVIATCRRLLEQHGGEVPADRAALEALPGVGRKTANVVLNTAFGEPTIAVDTHIFRLGNRTGLAPGKTVDEVERKLLRVTPEEFRKDAHHWLILHGRYVCKARKPECARCIVADLCAYRGKTV